MLTLDKITPSLIKAAKLALRQAAEKRAAEKQAFTPMDAQGPMPPPGQPPGPGGPPPGAGGPPPGDPSQGGPPPGQDGQGIPNGPPQAVTVSMQDLMQLFQQVAGGGGAPGGAPNEPGKAKGAGKDQILVEIKDKISNLENQYHQLFAFLTGAQIQQGGGSPDGSGNEPPGMGSGMDPNQAGNAMSPDQGAQPEAGAAPAPAPQGMQVQASLSPLASTSQLSKSAQIAERGRAMSNVLNRLRK